MHRSSCLLVRLEKLAALNEAEKDIVLSLEQQTTRVDTRSVLYEAGEEVTSFHVLRYGWALARNGRQEVRSQVVNFFFPGDIIGLHAFGTGRAAYDVRVRADASLAEVPFTRMRDLFVEAPRIAALFMALMGREQEVSARQIHSLGRHDATERVISFLLGVRDRLSEVGGRQSNRFDLPMTQVEIADHIGVTPVYVNKILRRLQADGRVLLTGPTVTLLDAEGMERQVGYTSLDPRPDLDWMQATAPVAG